MIHYHGTPFSGDLTVQMALKHRHACVSFASPGVLPHVAEVCQSFMLDNGAFTAWKTEKEYDGDKYCDFVCEWSKHPACDFWLIPDVIDGTEQQNRELVLRWDLDLPSPGVPVWHLHESIDWLERLAADFGRVALGSSGEYTQIGTPGWWSRMALAMDAVTDSEGRALVKLHGLRMLDPTIFSRFPFSSADSTNVARNIGIDSRWNNSPYAPRSRSTRALIMMDRIESHASATFWDRASTGYQSSLIG